MGVLGGRKETREVCDILETELAEGDCLGVLRADEGQRGHWWILRQGGGGVGLGRFGKGRLWGYLGSYKSQNRGVPL